jgi:hypothetical protein
MLVVNRTNRQYTREIDERRSELSRAEIGEIEARLRAEIQLGIADSKTEIMKWLFFVYWMATMLGLAALMVALTKQ